MASETSATSRGGSRYEQKMPRVRTHANNDIVKTSDKGGDDHVRPHAGSVMIETLKRWARILKRDVIALYLAARDPHTPWYAKAMAGIVAAYALSPIDLIPDFIPILGYLDDLILVPLGIALTCRMIPKEVMAACRIRALSISNRPRSVVGVILIASVWLLFAVGLAVLWL